MPIMNHYRVLAAHDDRKVGAEFVAPESPRDLSFVAMGFLDLLGAEVWPDKVANERRRRGIQVRDESAGNADVRAQPGGTAGGEDRAAG